MTVDGSPHAPVLVDAVIGFLAGRGTVVDMTLGAGGHAHALLDSGVGRVIGIDRDPDALAIASERLASFGDRLQVMCSTFAEAVVPGPVDGVLYDLGVSSMQLDQPERGFSYAHDAPLDMRMDSSSGITAAEVLNTYPAKDLAAILSRYGEERFARRIANGVVRARSKQPFDTSARLVEVIRSAIPAPARRSGGHPAKRTFQALRIEVNDELAVLERALPAAVGALCVGGRIVVMSYQSLEDRLAKRTLSSLATSTAPLDLPVLPAGYEPQLAMLTRGAERASEAEISANPRAASVRVRAAVRIREVA